MAEDTCPRGHARAENTYTYPSGKRQCRVCKRAATQRYRATPKGRVMVRRADHRYEMTLGGFLRSREQYLRNRRAAILLQLAALAEEEACPT